MQRGFILGEPYSSVIHGTAPQVRLANKKSTQNVREALQFTEFCEAALAWTSIGTDNSFLFLSATIPNLCALIPCAHQCYFDIKKQNQSHWVMWNSLIRM